MKRRITVRSNNIAPVNGRDSSRWMKSKLRKGDSQTTIYVTGPSSFRQHFIALKYFNIKSFTI